MGGVLGGVVDLLEHAGYGEEEGRLERGEVLYQGGCVGDVAEVSYSFPRQEEFNFLNGTEAARLNLPPGAIHATTPAASRVVDTAEGVHRRLHESLAEILIGDAADAGDRFAAATNNIGNCLLGRLRVEVVHNDPGAFAGELEGDLTTDSAAGAGHKGDFTL